MSNYPRVTPINSSKISPNIFQNPVADHEAHDVGRDPRAQQLPLLPGRREPAAGGVAPSGGAGGAGVAALLQRLWGIAQGHLVLLGEMAG